MDKKLDAQTGEAEEKDDPFRISDIGQILRSQGFWIVALLCVLYYSAIFPFQKYAVNMLQCNLTFTHLAEGDFWASNTVTIIQYFVMITIAATAFTSNFSKKASLKYGLLFISLLFLVGYCFIAYKRQSAEAIFAVFPLLAVGITPILGKYVDHKGKAASMLVLGSVLLIVCHLTFAFVLPMFKGNEIGGVTLAFVTILILGASFSLVPASLWLFPLLIGKILKASNPDIVQSLEAGTLSPAEAATSYNYTNPLLMLAMLGLVALLLGLYLRVVDRKKGYGLEEPNIKQ